MGTPEPESPGRAQPFRWRASQLRALPWRTLHSGLIRLALRRTLSPGIWISAALLGIWLAATSHVPQALLLAAGDARGIERGFLRQSVWGGMALFLIPVLVLHAAGFRRRRDSDAGWFACRALPHAGYSLSSWCGTALAGCALFAGVALATELRAASGAPPPSGQTSLRLSAHLRGLAPTLLEENAHSWRIDDPGDAAPPGSRLRVELTPVAGRGPTAEVELRAARFVQGAENAVRSARTRVSGRAAIEVELPPGPGQIVFRLSRLEGANLAVLAEDGLELWTPSSSERWASFELWLRCCTVVIAWTAIAMGIATWLSTPTAVLLVLFLASMSLLSGDWPAWWPGSDLGRALAITAEGRVPRALRGDQLAGLVACVALGWIASVAGQGPRRAGAHRASWERRG